jgi:peroxiredoxin family protein
MSTDSPPADGPADEGPADDGPADDGPDAATDDAADGPPSRAELAARVDELEAALSEATAESDAKKMSIIATKGTLDMAYPPLILASTAAAFGYDVTVFHTFWGLDILHEERSKRLKLSSVGNPNMPVPNAVGALPGMDRVTTRLMEKRIADNDTATIEELLETSLDMGVEFQACQMTIDLMDYDEDDFYDGVTTGVGAATALQDMAEADIQLLV